MSTKPSFYQVWVEYRHRCPEEWGRRAARPGGGPILPHCHSRAARREAFYEPFVTSCWTTNALILHWGFTERIHLFASCFAAHFSRSSSHSIGGNSCVGTDRRRRWFRRSRLLLLSRTNNPTPAPTLSSLLRSKRSGSKAEQCRRGGGEDKRKATHSEFPFFSPLLLLYNHMNSVFTNSWRVHSLKDFHSLPKAALTLLASRETCCKTNTRGNRLFSFSHWKKHFRFHLFSLLQLLPISSSSSFGSPIYSRDIFFSSILGFSLFFSLQLTWFQVCPFVAALLLEHKTEGEMTCGETEATFIHSSWEKKWGTVAVRTVL